LALAEQGHQALRHHQFLVQILFLALSHLLAVVAVDFIVGLHKTAHLAVLVEARQVAWVATLGLELLGRVTLVVIPLAAAEALAALAVTDILVQQMAELVFSLL
jgi:hypothetical protein